MSPAGSGVVKPGGRLEWRNFADNENLYYKIKMKELDVVSLLIDLPMFGVDKGTKGIILLVLDPRGEVFEVEFIDKKGETICTGAVHQNALELVSQGNR